MKYVICGSMAFSKERIETKITLEKFGHAVIIPTNSVKYASGEFALENGGESTVNKIAGNLIQGYFQ